MIFLFLIVWLLLGVLSHMLNEYCHKVCGFYQEFDSFGDVAVVILGPICGIIAIFAMIVLVGYAKIRKRLGK